MSTYSVGIVGCGTMGEAHAKAYNEHEETEIVAVADFDDAARAEHAATFDVPSTYDAHDAMLEGEDLDIVSVCTLHRTHAAITIDAAEAGVDGIWCEKPMATSLGEASDMLDAADTNDVKLTIAHQYRFNPVHEKAQALVANGAIGEPRLATTRAQGGLLNMGTHMIDMTRYFLGEPEYEWVIGQTERRTDRHERALAIEDRCAGQICFEDGTRLTHESDMPEPNAEGLWLHLSGTEGTLDLEFNNAVTITNDDGWTEYAPTMDRSLRDAYLEAFVEWLDGSRDDHRCSASKAYTVTEILMAIYESTRINGVIDAPLRTLENPLEVMIENDDLSIDYPGAYDIRLPYVSTRRRE